jgi:hypothetical protein
MTNSSTRLRFSASTAGPGARQELGLSTLGLSRPRDSSHIRLHIHIPQNTAHTTHVAHPSPIHRVPTRAY